MIDLARALGKRAGQDGRIWLFLDYDGTLAPFAPSPDVVLPDPLLIELISRFIRFPDRIRVAILSGRRLSHIERLLPVPGLFLAGTYGIEYIDWYGDRAWLMDLESRRPLLDRVKTQWAALLDMHPAVYLEDKGTALALHASRAPKDGIQELFDSAEELALQIVDQEIFATARSDNFLELAPRMAEKGQSIRALLERFDWQDAQLIYIGDDPKDESAFTVVNDLGGITILVAGEPKPTQAKGRLRGPDEVREWLAALVETLEKTAQPE